MVGQITATVRLVLAYSGLLMSPHCADGVYDDRNIPFPFPILQFIARNYITFPAVQSNIGQILSLPSLAECASMVYVLYSSEQIFILDIVSLRKYFKHSLFSSLIYIRNKKSPNPLMIQSLGPIEKQNSKSAK